MKRSKFTESQIIRAVQENENGRKAVDISRELEINIVTFHNRRKKYAGLSVQHLKRLKELEAENSKLMQMSHWILSY